MVKVNTEFDADLREVARVSVENFEKENGQTSI